MKKIILLFLVLLIPTVSLAEYKKLTKSQREGWTKPHDIEKIEKAAEKNLSVDYFGKMSQDKLKYFKKYGCPDVIGVWNCRDGSTGQKLEEWIYYGPSKYIYFYEKDGNLHKEETLTEIDKLSMDGKVEVGMDKIQVKRAKGEPSHMDNITGKDGADEKWTYNSLYVWFSGDKVIRVQK